MKTAYFVVGFLIWISVCAKACNYGGSLILIISLFMSNCETHESEK